jgi:cell division protein FtsL
MKKIKTLIIVVAVLLGSTVILAIDGSAKGAQLADIERQVAKLQDKNTQLKEKIINKNSLTQISGAASSLGLKPATRILYWNQDMQWASLP